MPKKIIWANFQRTKELFTQKIVTNITKKIWVWDPGSGKNLFRNPDPGVKKEPDRRSATLPVSKPPPPVSVASNTLRSPSMLHPALCNPVTSLESALANMTGLFSLTVATSLCERQTPTVFGFNSA
jgi:hypothetical protein